MIRARLSPRTRRTSREAVVPMINVVFLLLVFFLLTAQIVPAPPFAVELPAATAPRAGTTAPPLYVAADGRLAFGAEEGPVALAAAAAAGAVRIEADRALPAPELARLLAALAGAGAERLEIVTRETGE